METEEANSKTDQIAHKICKIRQTLPSIRTHRRSKHHNLAPIRNVAAAAAKTEIVVEIRVAEVDRLVRMMIAVIRRINRTQIHDQTPEIRMEIHEIHRTHKIHDQTIIETRTKIPKTIEEIPNKTTEKAKEPDDVSRRKSL